MSILFGHPAGNPNAHQAALAHWERGRLEAFCVAWMPTDWQLAALGKIPGFSSMVARLRRRQFRPLAGAPRIEGRLAEWSRLLRRLLGADHEGLAYEANDWLMHTMARECRRSSVTAVHSYEDCSLGAFQEAKRRGRACLYDLPIGYYPAWQETQARLVRERADWLPAGGAAITRHVRPEQKRREMELADLVLAPSTFVLNTIRQFHPEKAVALAPYGVDLDYWHPNSAPRPEGRLRFLYVGQCSIRKGIPLLLDAWAAAGLQDAQLDLVGGWHLAEHVLGRLPGGVVYRGPSAREALRRHYQQADVFILPSYFEGFGLVILEAMACGLPVITSDATAGPDLFAGDEGCVFPVGNRDGLIEALRSYAAQRDRLPQLRRAARTRAEQFTWTRYRQCVAAAVAPFAGRAPVVASAAVPA